LTLIPLVEGFLQGRVLVQDRVLVVAYKAHILLVGDYRRVVVDF